jgi:transposase
MDKKGVLSEVGAQQKPMTEAEAELLRVKRELAEVKMERDLLKKAAAYFAKESQKGTRS